MTALAANTALTIKNREGQSQRDAVILTAAVMYHHALAVTTAAGKAKAAANDATSVFLGLVEIENPDDSTAGITGDGTLRTNTISDVDVLMICTTAVSAGDMGSPAYAVDDATVGTDNTLGPEVGYFSEYVTTNSAWVRLGKKALAKAV